MYFQPHMVDLVRTVGYEGKTTDEVRERMKELTKTHDKEKLVAGCEELFDIDAKEVKLKAHVRKLAWQLLGFPPEYKETSTTEMVGIKPKEEAKPVRTEKPQPKAKKTAQKPKKQESAPVKPKSRQPEANAPCAPIMQQYRAAKEKHPGMILLFRMGDFYEMFEDDARTCSKLLGLTLTSRDKSLDMAGFPHHQLEVYLKKLLKEGRRVAVCDPVPETLAKGPITREVQRVVVPEDGDFSDEPA